MKDDADSQGVNEGGEAVKIDRSSFTPWLPYKRASQNGRHLPRRVSKERREEVPMKKALEEWGDRFRLHQKKKGPRNPAPATKEKRKRADHLISLISLSRQLSKDASFIVRTLLTLHKDTSITIQLIEARSPVCIEGQRDRVPSSRLSTLLVSPEQVDLKGHQDLRSFRKSMLRCKINETHQVRGQESGSRSLFVFLAS